MPGPRFDDASSAGYGGRSGGLPPLPPHLDPRGRHRGTDRRGRSGRYRRAATVATAALCTLLSVALLVASGSYWWKFHQFNNGLSKLDITAAGHGHDIDGKDQNILVVGNDDRQTATDAELAELHTGRDGGSLNTDTMMIIHVPANGEKA
ncbi:MAG: hypothetical protein ABI232_07120, partial [Jatrophihabitantaceae bacterium]